MSRIADLEERRAVGDTLTAAEDGELNALRGQHPEIAADVDRLDHRYRYWYRKELEIAKKAGMGWSKVYEAAKAKARPFRDPRKMATISDLREGPTLRMHNLEIRRFDQRLTPAEAEELEELHRRYPERAERMRKMIVRRKSENEAMKSCSIYPSRCATWPVEVED